VSVPGYPGGVIPTIHGRRLRRPGPGHRHAGPTNWSAGRWAWFRRSTANAWAPSAWPAASSRPRSGTRPSEPTPFRAIAGGFTAVEAEFIIRLGKDAPADKTEWTAEEAAEYVGELIVGVEIAGSPLATINQLGPPIVASDFGNNDGQILGHGGRELARHRLGRHAAPRPSSTACRVGKGGAASIPGSPLAALAFLLGHVASRGRPLKKGMLVTTGASTGIHDVAAGDAARVDFGPFGSVACVAVPARK
jgi:2-keto-4-pentenoate hydratase